MQTENDVRNRISAVFAEFGETQNKLAGGDSATQKRLNRQLSDNGAAITVDTLLLKWCHGSNSQTPDNQP